MASNPPIDAVPDHLRERSDPSHTIQRYLAGSRPFSHEFIKRGREHIDRALERDENRARAERERKEREREGLSVGSSKWEGTGSTVTGLTRGSSRSAGVVKRMRRKDGSCPGEPLGRVSYDKQKVDEEEETDVILVLKRTEVESRKPTRQPLIPDKTPANKENRRPDIQLAPSKEKRPTGSPVKLKKQPNEMQIDLPGPSRRILANKRENELEMNIIKKGLEEVDLESMTSSARRRHERKIRRRIKSAIRHTPSKPLDLDSAGQSDEEEREEEDEDEGDIIHVLPRLPSTSRPGQQPISNSTLPTSNEPATTIRKRKGNVGIALMTSFTSASMAKGKRMTLIHQEREGRGFLGGKKVSSGRTGVGMTRQGLVRAPSSSPPSKFRRVEPVLKVQAREREERSDPTSGSVRRSARLGRKDPDSSVRHGEEREESRSRSRSNVESRSSISRKMAVSLAQIPEGQRLMDEPEPELELEWSVSSPGRGRAEPPREIRLDDGLGDRDGRHRTPSFHVRTDTPVSRPSHTQFPLQAQPNAQSRQSPLRPVLDEQIGARRALGTFVQVDGEGDVKAREKIGKKGERNWFKPPRAKARKRKYPDDPLPDEDDRRADTRFGDEDYREDDGMGYRFGRPGQGEMRRILPWTTEDEKENLGTYCEDGLTMGMQMEAHGMDLDHTGYQLGDLDLNQRDQVCPRQDSMEGYIMPLELYSGGPYASYETDCDDAVQQYPNENDGVIQPYLDDDIEQQHPYELAQYNGPMELDVHGTELGVQVDPEQMMDDEDSEPAIDMFGTRVSELQRQIFVEGRGRW